MELTKLNCARGAPMGRHGHDAHGCTDLVFEIEEVPLVDYCYDYGGAYWGSGQTLFAYRAELDGEEVAFNFIRATDRDEAIAKVLEDYPECTVASENGSIIEATIKFLQGLTDLDEEQQEDTDREVSELEDQLWHIRKSNPQCKPDGMCKWFLHCVNPATTSLKHPVLGDVPCCERCHDRGHDREPASQLP